MNKDTLHRVLAGCRPITVAETLRILSATGVSAEAGMLLALFASEDIAQTWMDVGAIDYLGELFRSVPVAFAQQLGDRLSEVKPRWGVGSAALVARSVSDHINDLTWRDQSFGEAGLPAMSGVP